MSNSLCMHLGPGVRHAHSPPGSSLMASESGLCRCTMLRSHAGTAAETSTCGVAGTSLQTGVPWRNRQQHPHVCADELPIYKVRVHEDEDGLFQRASQTVSCCTFLILFLLNFREPRKSLQLRTVQNGKTIPFLLPLYTGCGLRSALPMFQPSSTQEAMLGFKAKHHRSNKVFLVLCAHFIQRFLLCVSVRKACFSLYPVL